MKNRLPFAALTFSFSIAGACVAFGLRETPETAGAIVAVVAFVGGIAAALCGEQI